MEEYIDENVAFVLDSFPELSNWPHDRRQAFRTHRHHIVWPSLVKAFRESYQVARENPARYLEMARNSERRQRRDYRVAKAADALKQFFKMRTTVSAASRPR